jgi:hypothetical protein
VRQIYEKLKGLAISQHKNFRKLEKKIQTEHVKKIPNCKKKAFTKFCSISEIN